MLKILKIFIFLIIWCIELYACNYEDIVYFKNGNILYGLVIETIPGKYLKLQTPTGKILVFDINNISRISKRCSVINYSGNIIVDIGSFVATGNYGISRIKTSVVKTIENFKYCSVGGGTGFNYYYNLNTYLWPVFMNFRIFFKNKDFISYFSFNIGNTFNITNQFSNVGIFINPNVGISFRICDRNFFNISVGYEGQFMKYKHYFPNYIELKNSGAFGFRLGFSL